MCFAGRKGKKAVAEPKAVAEKPVEGNTRGGRKTKKPAAEPKEPEVDETSHDDQQSEIPEDKPEQPVEKRGKRKVLLLYPVWNHVQDFGQANLIQNFRFWSNLVLDILIKFGNGFQISIKQISYYIWGFGEANLVHKTMIWYISRKSEGKNCFHF